jgi:hypothetical protein
MRSRPGSRSQFRHGHLPCANGPWRLYQMAWYAHIGASLRDPGFTAPSSRDRGGLCCPAAPGQREGWGLMSMTCYHSIARSTCVGGSSKLDTRTTLRARPRHRGSIRSSSSAVVLTPVLRRDPPLAHQDVGDEVRGEAHGRRAAVRAWSATTPTCRRSRNRR